MDRGKGRCGDGGKRGREGKREMKRKKGGGGRKEGDGRKEWGWGEDLGGLRGVASSVYGEIIGPEQVVVMELGKRHDTNRHNGLLSAPPCYGFATRKLV